MLALRVGFFFHPRCAPRGTKKPPRRTDLLVTSHESPDCLDRRTLAALAAGKLSAADVERVQAHLPECPRCLSIVAATVRGAKQKSRAPKTEGFSSGTVIGRKYRLIAPISRGSGGAIWRAEPTLAPATVAVKILSRQHQSSPDAQARFEREVRLGGALRSPYVVQVLDHGIDEESGHPYIVTELFEGETLEHLLTRHRRLSPSDAFRIAGHVVRALRRAHAEGVVHRNLKPSNIFIARGDAEPIVKVMDFGLAQWRPNVTLGVALTQPGTVLGTPRYMSPEQIRGLASLDGRADLWSLSVIVAECLTGRRMFNGDHFAAVAAAILDVSRRPIPSRLGRVPSGFDAWFARATHRDINQRFQTPRELLETLGGVFNLKIPREKRDRDGRERDGRERDGRGREGREPGRGRDRGEPREPTMKLRRGASSFPTHTALDSSSSPPRLLPALLAVLALGSAVALWFVRDRTPPPFTSSMPTEPPAPGAAPLQPTSAQPPSAQPPLPEPPTPPPPPESSPSGPTVTPIEDPQAPAPKTPSRTSPNTNTEVRSLTPATQGTGSGSGANTPSR